MQITPEQQVISRVYHLQQLVNANEPDWSTVNTVAGEIAKMANKINRRNNMRALVEQYKP